MALALLLVLAQASAAKTVDLRALLAEAGDPTSLARFPEPAYRLRSGTLGADLEGPGALVRVEAEGPLRIRVDDAEAPLVLEELRVPILFARRCRVDAGKGSGSVLFRAYAPGTAVKTAADAEAPRPVEPAGKDTFTFTISEEIPEGLLACLDPKLASGPRAVTSIHLRAEAADLAAALERATLRLAFDGETTVACPLGAFFGGAAPGKTSKSRFLEVQPGVDEATGREGTQIELRCRFVMPYRERFELSIDARGAGDLHVAGLVRTMPWTWDERTLRFSALASASSPIRLEGRGVLLGDGRAERIVADGETLALRDFEPVPFTASVEVRGVARVLAYVSPSR